MNTHFEEFMRLPRDSKRERELARKLRQIPEEERFEVIQKFINFHIFMGLTLAYTCLQKPKYFGLLLNQALEVADASNIQYWLECVIPKLGFKRVMRILSRKLDKQPDAVGQALYFMEKFVPPGDDEAIGMLEDMRQTVQP